MCRSPAGRLLQPSAVAADSDGTDGSREPAAVVAAGVVVVAAAAVRVAVDDDCCDGDGRRRWRMTDGDLHGTLVPAAAGGA